MENKIIEYIENNLRLSGYAAYNALSKEKMPAVLVCHAWFGQDEFARQKAKMLAELGYVGFAVDVYGEGKVVDTPEDATNLMKPLIQDRKTLRRRLLAAVDAVKKMPEVDVERIGVIGFCFGGACALELAREGADIRAVVSFHGLLHRDTTIQDKKIKAAILALHGYEDPLVSQEDIQNFQKEMNDAKVDWQMVVYGNATHAFTNPQARSPEKGLQFNKKVAERAWKAMEDFLRSSFTSNILPSSDKL